MKSLFTFLLILPFTIISAQNTWKTTQFPNIDYLLSEIDSNHYSQLESYENKSALEEIYTWRKEYLEYLFESKAILYYDSLYDYIDFIFEEIVSSNIELKDLKLRYFILNSPDPNAFSLGDGTFFFNIGLLRKLNNEGQLAYIICHEISHYYLDHSNQFALARYEKTNTANYKEELKSIKKAKFGKYELTRLILKKNFYSEMSYSRENEKEADSLGLLFLKKTSYDLNQAVICMNLLDSIDYYKYSNAINYKEILDFENYPFKTRWLEQESIIFGGQVQGNYWDRDSIKSHPDSKTRALLLKSYIADIKTKSTNKFIQDSTCLNRIKEQADYEFIDSWIFYNNFGKALFFALKQLETDRNNKILLLDVSHILKLIYDSQVNHEFSKYVDRPSSGNEVEYNYFLNFLENIRLIELAKLSYHYHLAHYQNLENNEEFLNNYNFFKSIITN